MGDNPLVQPDPGLFIWTIVTFLVLLSLLAKFAWRPLLQALESRQESIRKSLDDARQAKLELERLQQESVQILRQARIEAESIIARSREDAERLREELKQKARAEAEAVVKKARAEADAVVKNAERQISLETARALQQIRTEAVDLSVMIASKIIQRNLSKEDNERLIDEALRQVQNRSH